MDVYQQIYKVVYGEYRPWLMENTSATKFKEMYHELKEPRPVNGLCYAINYSTPISYKRKFYTQLIDHDVIYALNSLYHKINSGITTNQRKHYFYDFIHQFINLYCYSTKHIIKERDLTEEAFVPQDGFVPEGNRIDEAYIFHYLKHQLIRNYLEVCAQYPEYVKEPNTGLAEAYSQYFSEIHNQPPVLLKTN